MGSLFIQMFVAEKYNDIGENHKKIQYVNRHYYIGAVEDLVDYAGYVTEENDEEKPYALTRCVTAAPGLYKIKRPGNTEAYKHTCFENTHCYYPPRFLITGGSISLFGEVGNSRTVVVIYAVMIK